MSLKQGWFCRVTAPASTAAGHCRGFGGAHHPSPKATLTGGPNGDLTPPFAKEPHKRRSQSPAARQQKCHCLAVGIQPQRGAVTSLGGGEQTERVHYGAVW